MLSGAYWLDCAELVAYNFFGRGHQTRSVIFAAYFNFEWKNGQRNILKYIYAEPVPEGLFLSFRACCTRIYFCPLGYESMAGKGIIKRQI